MLQQVPSKQLSGEKENQKSRRGQLYLKKGNFEPIVSEELWDYCNQLRKRKIKEYDLLDGETRRLGYNNPKAVWAQKLKCRCGAHCKRYKWRVKQSTGEVVYGYQCYSRTRSPAKSYLQAHGVSVFRKFVMR